MEKLSGSNHLPTAAALVLNSETLREILSYNEAFPYGVRSRISNNSCSVFSQAFSAQFPYVNKVKKPEEILPETVSILNKILNNC